MDADRQSAWRLWDAGKHSAHFCVQAHSQNKIGYLFIIMLLFFFVCLFFFLTKHKRFVLNETQHDYDEDDGLLRW